MALKKIEDMKKQYVETNLGESNNVNEFEVSYPELLFDMESEEMDNFMCVFQIECTRGDTLKKFGRTHRVINIDGLITFCKRIDNLFVVNKYWYNDYTKKKVSFECRGGNIKSFVENILPRMEKITPFRLTKINEVSIGNESFFSIMLIDKLNALIEDLGLTSDEINREYYAWSECDQKKRKLIMNLRSSIEVNFSDFGFVRYLRRWNYNEYQHSDMFRSYLKFPKQRWITLFFGTPVDSFNAQTEFEKSMDNKDSLKKAYFGRYDLTAPKPLNPPPDPARNDNPTAPPPPFHPPPRATQDPSPEDPFPNNYQRGVGFCGVSNNRTRNSFLREERTRRRRSEEDVRMELNEKRRWRGRRSQADIAIDFDRFDSLSRDEQEECIERMKMRRRKRKRRPGGTIRRSTRRRLNPWSSGRGPQSGVTTVVTTTSDRNTTFVTTATTTTTAITTTKARDELDVDEEEEDQVIEFDHIFRKQRDD